MGGESFNPVQIFTPPKPPKVPTVNPMDEERRRAARAREEQAQAATRGRRSLIATSSRGVMTGGAAGQRKTLLGE